MGTGSSVADKMLGGSAAGAVWRAERGEATVTARRPESERPARSPSGVPHSAGRRLRLDVALVERGLEASRERARRLIVAGDVTVNGEVARAPSTLVPADATLAIGRALPYVSRGGLKLAHALDRFGIVVTGWVCLDAGASTGGFTDCLLQRGAGRVYAVDVGKGQLAWRLRQDPRVVVVEGVNVRHLRLKSGARELAPDRADGRAAGGPPASTASAAGRPQDAAAAGGNGPELPEPVRLATVDLAFISLRLVLPAVAGVLDAAGEVVALVKPQFEAGPADVGKGGVVRQPAVHRRVLGEALAAARAAGLTPTGLTASPIRGQAGNVEFLLWARPPPAGPARFDEAAAIDEALAEASGQ
jgi:23S rRNA (cytidine1920-2'-O)/16S rRNA (cytidine1409-2'-O)-methyltransferase